VCNLANAVRTTVHNVKEGGDAKTNQGVRREGEGGEAVVGLPQKSKGWEGHGGRRRGWAGTKKGSRKESKLTVNVCPGVGRGLWQWSHIQIVGEG